MNESSQDQYKNRTYRKWNAVLNNPQDHGIDNPEKFLEKAYYNAKLIYISGQLEKGENGTPHIQFTFMAKDPIRLSYVRKNINNQAHYIPIHKEQDQKYIDYTQKSETRIDGPWVFGDITQAKKCLVKHKAKTVVEWAQLSYSELAQSSAPNLYNQTVKAIDHFKAQLPPYKHHEPRGIWIWGDPGCGKSTLMHNKYPGHYTKYQNKWWCGYNYETIVVLEDYDNDMVFGHLLKLWADKWSTAPEKKGGQVSLQHRIFCVTSNYSIQQLSQRHAQKTNMPRDYMLEAALLRRFHQYQFKYKTIDEELPNGSIIYRKTDTKQVVIEFDYESGHDNKPHPEHYDETVIPSEDGSLLTMRQNAEQDIDQTKELVLSLNNSVQI